MIRPVRMVVGTIKPSSKRPWEAGYMAELRTQLKDLESIIKTICEGFEEVVPQVCYNALEPTFQLSQTLCPVKTGELKASGFMEIVEVYSQPQVVIGYAKGGVPYYAILVHENLEFYHKPPTQAKFLESAVDQTWDEIHNGIVQGMEEFWASGEQQSHG